MDFPLDLGQISERKKLIQTQAYKIYKGSTPPRSYLHPMAQFFYRLKSELIPIQH